jgi:hypothetical protein
MWTTPSGDSLFNDHPFGTFEAWSGRRPPHHSRRFWYVRSMSGYGVISEAPVVRFFRLKTSAWALIQRQNRERSRRPKARWLLDESWSRFSLLFAHDLFEKPLHTFPDHALIGEQMLKRRKI